MGDIIGCYLFAGDANYDAWTKATIIDGDVGGIEIPLIPSNKYNLARSLVEYQIRKHDSDSQSETSMGNINSYGLVHGTIEAQQRLKKKAREKAQRRESANT